MIDFIIAFITCFVGYAFHTITHYFEHINKKVSIPHTLFELLITIGWLGWVYMLFSDPLRIELPVYLTIAGIVFLIIGGVVAGLGFFEKKGFGHENKLITKGVYSKIRHPMYLGLILLHLGLPIVMQSIITLVSAVLWIAQILAWKYWEEKSLVKRFKKKYLDYKKRTIF